MSLVIRRERAGEEHQHGRRKKLFPDAATMEDNATVMLGKLAPMIFGFVFFVY